MQHYDERYFSWQDKLGQFGGKANLYKFVPYIQLSDRVLDFGCGGGHLLNNLTCAVKAGLEVNAAARERARQFGFPVYADLKEVPDDFASVIISNSVLEHIECPLYELRRLITKVEPGGKAIFIILNQIPQEAYVPDDKNRHLYTWNPMTLGTLLEEAGFVDIEIDVIRYAWKPKFARWYRLGQWAFDLRCKLCAYLERNYQVRAVAHRPAD